MNCLTDMLSNSGMQKAPSRTPSRHQYTTGHLPTRSSAVAEGPRDVHVI